MAFKDFISGGNAAKLLLGGLSQFGSVINNESERRTAKENTDKTIAGQKELAQYQYQQEMEQLKYMNQYNTPQKQKERLTEANLNPALMYNSAPQNTQTQLPKYNAPALEYKYAPFKMGNVGATLSNWQDVRMKSVQVDNLKAQQDNIKMDTAMKAASSGKSLADTARSKYDLELAQEMKKYSLDILETKTHREWAQYLNEVQDWNVKQKDIDLKKVERQLKYEDLKLRKRGIYPGDPIYIRTLLQNVPELKKLMEKLNKDPI